MFLEERASTHVYRQQQMLSKEELAQVERLCVHEQPAYCVASCPLKLDTKSMIQAIAEGNWQKALQLYEKITPFPYILSAGCDAPCESSCKLCEIGDGLAIRRLEQAVVLYGEKPKGRGLPRMKKKKTVAIFGSGLFCLFLAGELQKKAYPVTVFCEEPDLETYLKQETEFLSADAFAATLKSLQSMDLTFRFSTDLAALETLRQTFDVSCASYSLAEKLYPEL